MSEPIDLDAKLRERLASSLRQQEKQQQEFQQQLATLGQLVQRISHLSYGLDPELDNHLHRLSSLLNHTDNLGRYQNQLTAISEYLRQQQSQHEQRLSGWQSSLNETLKQLHHLNGLPGDLRRQLKSLMAELYLPRVSLYRLLPTTQDALSLLLKVVSLQRRTPDAIAMSQSPSEADLMDELMSLVSRLRLSGADHDLHQIRRQLLAPMNRDALMSLCLEFLKIMVRVLDDERQQAKRYLSQVSANLISLHQQASDVLSSCEQQSKAMATLNEDISAQLSSLNDAAAESGWDEVCDTLGKLTLLWQQKQLQESEAWQAQQQRLSTMEQQLADLESAAEQYRDRLAQQRIDSLTDSLTQLPNRAAFDERVSVEHKRLQRFGHPLWMAVIDIDHFKDINDSYGHTAGDKTLRFIAHSLRRCLRETDFIARYGGEEFVILFPELSDEDIHRPLEKMAETVRQIPFKFRDEDVRITISIGATQVQPYEQPMAAFERADQALYQAKHGGRDKVVIINQD